MKTKAQIEAEAKAKAAENGPIAAAGVNALPQVFNDNTAAGVQNTNNVLRTSFNPETLYPGGENRKGNTGSQPVSSGTPNPVYRAPVVTRPPDGSTVVTPSDDIRAQRPAPTVPAPVDPITAGGRSFETPAIPGPTTAEATAQYTALGEELKQMQASGNGDPQRIQQIVADRVHYGRVARGEDPAAIAKQRSLEAGTFDAVQEANDPDVVRKASDLFPGGRSPDPGFNGQRMNPDESMEAQIAAMPEEERKAFLAKAQASGVNLTGGDNPKPWRERLAEIQKMTPEQAQQQLNARSGRNDKQLNTNPGVGGFVGDKYDEYGSPLGPIRAGLEATSSSFGAIGEGGRKLQNSESNPVVRAIGRGAGVLGEKISDITAEQGPAQRAIRLKEGVAKDYVTSVADGKPFAGAGQLDSAGNYASSQQAATSPIRTATPEQSAGYANYQADQKRNGITVPPAQSSEEADFFAESDNAERPEVGQGVVPAPEDTVAPTTAAEASVAKATTSAAAPPSISTLGPLNTPENMANYNTFSPDPNSRSGQARNPYIDEGGFRVDNKAARANVGVPNANLRERRASALRNQNNGGAFSRSGANSGSRGNVNRGGLGDLEHTLDGRNARDVSALREMRRQFNRDSRSLRGSSNSAKLQQNRIDLSGQYRDQMTDFAKDKTDQERNSIYARGQDIDSRDRNRRIDAELDIAKMGAQANASKAAQERSDEAFTRASEVGLTDSKGNISRFAPSGNQYNALKLLIGDSGNMTERQEADALTSAGRVYQWLGAIGEKTGQSFDTLEGIPEGGFDRGGARWKDVDLVPGFGTSGNVSLWDWVWNEDTISYGNTSLSTSDLAAEYDLPNLSKKDRELLTKLRDR